MRRTIGFVLALRRYAKNSAWVVTDQIFRILAGLGVSILFAYLAPTEVLGDYYFLLSLVALVTIVSIPGANAALLQSVVRGFEGSYRPVLYMRFRHSLIGILLLLLIDSYYLFKDADLAYSLFILAICFPLLNPFRTYEAFLRGKEDFATCAKFAIFYAVLNLAVMTAVLMVKPDSLLIIIFAYATTMALSNSFFTFLSLKLVSRSKQDPGLNDYAFFLTKIGVIQVIARHMDKILVGVFLGSAQLAIYVIGSVFALKIIDFIKNMIFVYSPTIVRKNTAKLSWYLVLFLISVAATLLPLILLPTIVPFLFSQQYVDSIYISQIIIIGLPFTIIALFYRSHFLYHLKDQRVLQNEVIAVSVIKIISMPPFLFFLGSGGLATVIALQGFISLLCLSILNKIFNRSSSI